MIMKHLIRTLASVAVLLALASCTKANYSSFWVDPSRVAKTTIHFAEAYSFRDIVTSFNTADVFRKSDQEGKSLFTAYCMGEAGYDSFMFRLYFDNIDNMQLGGVLKPSSFSLSFLLSSDLFSSASSYEGKIYLVSRGKDYIILNLDNVRCRCIYGEYVTDGYLKCQLCNEFVLDN